MRGAGAARDWEHATAQHLDVPLWTLNVRHFPMFKSLARPY